MIITLPLTSSNQTEAVQQRGGEKMAGVLTGLSSLFGLFGGAKEISQVHAAGQAQEIQASEFLKQNLALTQELGQSVIQASRYNLSSTAETGRYSLSQNSLITAFDARYKIASKWMQVLGGM